MQNIVPIKTPQQPSSLRVIAVASGKGGVGKTLFATNLATLLGAMGKRVLIIDADLGLANVDIVLGLAPRFHIGHILSEQRSIEEVVVQAGPNVWVLPAASGVPELAEMSDTHKLAMLSLMDALEQRYDFILIDNAAGIGSTVVYFTGAGREVVIMLTPEPTAVTDAYGAIKVFLTRAGVSEFDLVINQVRDEREGEEVFGRLSMVTARFLNSKIQLLGSIRRDENMTRAVLGQEPIVTLFPQSPASRCIKQIADRLIARRPTPVLGRSTFAPSQGLEEQP